MSKNVILILVDQMRGDCLGVNGNQNIMTPFLDDLAIDGVNYTNAHATNPSCIPARANILTGLPAYKNGFFGYCDGVEWNYSNTIVDQFNDRGFKTINVGKTHFYKQRNGMNFQVNKLYDPIKLDNDFKSDYHIWLEQQDTTIEDPALIYDNNGWPLYEWPGESYYHPTEWTMRTAIDELAKVGGEKFFMQISFHRPHPPFDPPSFYYDMYHEIKFEKPVIGEWAKENANIETTVHGQYGKIDDKYLNLAKRGYYASITHIDYQVGRLVNYLRSNKLYEDTTIIFTSDHGEMLGDHHMFRKATPFRGSIHIPLIIKNNQQKGMVSTKLATHVDILPTALGTVEKYKNSIPDSYDLLKLNSRTYLIGEHPFDKGWNFVLTSNYKYIWDSVSGQEWCFDIVEDLEESENIIDSIIMDELLELRSLLIVSFKNRGLTQFIENNQLKAGEKLPAYDQRFNINIS